MLNARHALRNSTVCLSALARKIEAEVVPKLVLRHRALNNTAVTQPGWPEAPCDVAVLANVLIAGDLAGAHGLIEALLDRGVSDEEIRRDLLGPTARRLGEMWDQDEYEFAAILLGLGILRQILLTLCPPLAGESMASGQRRRALLVSLSGERHTFGLRMISDRFSLAGWEVETIASIGDDELDAMIEGNWFTIVGFAVGTDAHLDRVAESIRHVRRGSRNRAVGIIVGGPAFVGDPGLALRVGADGTAPDAEHAVRLAESLRFILEDAAF